ncbi:MAG: NB-ARC domain-containing protein, partial [Acidimicrobiia bacterium]
MAFLFTDLEQSTRLWEDHASAMAELLSRHDAILRQEIDTAGGYIFSTAGDSFGAAFDTVDEAIRAASSAQRRLRSEASLEGIALSSRMGIHAGVSEERDGNYFGSAVNRAARIMSAGHGGQVLLSELAAELQSGAWDLQDLGTHRLRDLPEPIRLFQLVLNDRNMYPPLSTVEEAQNNLPPIRKEWFGRHADIEAVSVLLDEAGVVTLTGMGGVGKTSLALQVARSRLDRHAAVYFVDLSAIRDQRGLIEEVATTIGLDMAELQEGEASVVRALRSRDLLLLLDNCEQVIESAAAFVDRVASSSPPVKILATSRGTLGIEGERVHRVDPLPEEDSIRLFLDRANKARPELVIDEELRGRIREICRHLDGLPLAVELAAARTSHMTIPDISEHLDQRFRLLAAAKGPNPSRHGTLQATIDWSYELLTGAEKGLFEATAVFSGGFDASALAEVTGSDELDTLDGIRSLVDKALITLDPGDTDVTRYRLLETLRMYALERLETAGGLEEMRHAHARVYLERARRHPPQVREPYFWGYQRAAVPDLENNLLALEWLDRIGDLESLAQLASRLNSLYGSRFIDAQQRVMCRDDVMAAIGDRSERAFYCYASAEDASLRADFQAQYVWGQRAMEEAEEPFTKAAAAAWVANALLVLDPIRTSEVVMTGLRELPDGSAGEIRLNLTAQSVLAEIMNGVTDNTIERVTDLYRQGLDFAGFELPFLLHNRADYESALRLLDELEPLAENPLAARVPLLRGIVAAERGDFDRARDNLLEAAAMVEKNPVRFVDSDVLIGFAALAHLEGDECRASRLLAPVGLRLRSPASYALYVHYRDLVKEA